MRLTYGKGRLVPTVVLDPHTILWADLRQWPPSNPCGHEYVRLSGEEWTCVLCGGPIHERETS